MRRSLEGVDAARECARHERRQQVLHQPARRRHLGEESREQRVGRDHHRERVRKEARGKPAGVAAVAGRGRLRISAWQHHVLRLLRAGRQPLHKAAVRVRGEHGRTRRPEQPLSSALLEQSMRLLLGLAWRSGDGAAAAAPPGETPDAEAPSREARAHRVFRRQWDVSKLLELWIETSRERACSLLARSDSIDKQLENSSTNSCK